MRTSTKVSNGKNDLSFFFFLTKKKLLKFYEGIYVCKGSVGVGCVLYTTCMFDCFYENFSFKNSHLCLQKNPGVSPSRIVIFR